MAIKLAGTGAIVFICRECSSIMRVFCYDPNVNGGNGFVESKFKGVRPPDACPSCGRALPSQPLRLNAVEVRIERLRGAGARVCQGD